MDIIFNANPLIIFAIVTFSSLVIFLVIWLLLKQFYSKASGKWPFLNRVIEKARGKWDTPLVQKYGLVGLVIFMALPFPTIGVYGATLLCWLMGVKWWSSLITVVTGATIYNSIILLSAFGITQAMGLSG